MIPDYERMMLPLLKFLEDEHECFIGDGIEHISKVFNVTQDEKKRLLPSGHQSIVANRVGWAKTYLLKAGLLESTKRGYFRITKRGLDVLAENPPEINGKFLARFPEFLEFKAVKKEEGKGKQKKITDVLDPVELLAEAYRKINNELSETILREIKKSTPSFFEKLVVELLVKMGYGGSREDAGRAIGQTGDEGIDGIIKEDKLGLDAVYLQAKRWGATVGRPEIHKFVGALKGQAANKGIFITTSTFSNEAKEYASKIDSPKIVLIDGAKLAELMIEHDVGVSKTASYDIKKIDSDFFSGE
jgi:restriction system protein